MTRCFSQLCQCKVHAEIRLRNLSNSKTEEKVTPATGSGCGVVSSYGVGFCRDSSSVRYYEETLVVDGHCSAVVSNNPSLACVVGLRDRHGRGEDPSNHSYQAHDH